jgi:hypothetical protein
MSRRADRRRRRATGALAGALLASLVLGTAGPAPVAAADPVVPLGNRLGVTPISDVNANTASGFSPLEFFTVTIQGVAQVETGPLDPFDRVTPSTWLIVDDGTGAVAVAHPGTILTDVSPGDRVEVFGLVLTQNAVPIRGTRTIDLGSVPGASVTILGTAPEVDPVAIAAGELATRGVELEGSRVRVSGLTIVDPGEWPTPGSSGFVRVTDGTDEIRLYVDDDTDLDEAVPPAAAFDLLGFVTQDDPSFGSPPFEHYILPASVADLVAGDGSGLVTVSPGFVVEDQTGVALRFDIVGQQATLESVEIAIPTTWTWEAPGTLASEGDGLTGATVGYRLDAGQYIVEISGAALTATEAGAVTVGSLRAPSSPGTSTFTVQTATAGGTLSPIPGSPRVTVVADAGVGDILLNEIYANTLRAAQGREVAEFVELRNVSGDTLDIAGWTLADIGTDSTCTLGPRWAFPDIAASELPPGAYAVVCRTALDSANQRGFLLTFPGFAVSDSVRLFEMYEPDEGPASRDHGPTPNLVLLDDNPGRDDQMVYLGGVQTNAGQCESPNVPGRYLPFSELVALRDVTGQVIDVLEYREAGPCEGDLCSGGLTGPDDAYPWGAPAYRHSLGRHPDSTSTGSSRLDLYPSSTPTPGGINSVVDSLAPGLPLGRPPVALSGSVIEVRFDESVEEASATDPANYTLFRPATSDSFPITEVLVDPEDYPRHFFLVTEGMPKGETLSLRIAGVTDLLVKGTGGNAMDTTVTLDVSPYAATICEVQEFDASGFSPMVGDTVVVAGFVTIGDLPSFPLIPGVVPFDRISIWVQEPGGCGVNVFSFVSADTTEIKQFYPDVQEFGVRRNDLVQIQGRVVEFVSSTSGNGAVTEIERLENFDPFYRFLLRGLDGPEPIEVTTGEAGNEALEGTLVRTEGTAINANSLAVYIDDGSGAIQIFQNFSSLDLTEFGVGDRIDVTGVITQFDSSEPFLSGYELVPQSQESIFEVEGGFAPGDPVVAISPRGRVLVPDLGETILIETTSPSRSDVIVEIFDSVGRRITTLYDGIGLGKLDFRWDGRGQDGRVVDPGMYIVHVRSVPLDGGSVRTESAPIVVGLRLDGTKMKAAR